MVEYQLPKLNTRVRFPSLAFSFSRGLAILITCFLAGCAVSEEQSVAPPVVTQQAGVYHKIRKGETLWRLSQVYNVGLDEIIKANHISDAAIVEERQLIFIPGATEVKEAVVHEQDPNETAFKWPLQGKITRYYGDWKAGFLSKGIAIAAKENQVVCASRRGKVVFADYLIGYGQTVILDHLDGFHTVYSQNSKILVKLDDFVYKGDQLSLVGKTGNQVFLHFQVRKNGREENPLFYLPRI